VEQFPFDLKDIKGWIIRKHDGTAIRYEVTRPDDFAKTNERARERTGATGPAFWNRSGGTTSYSTHYSAWCHHEPVPTKDEPIFEKDGIRLFIADAMGAKAVHQLYDVAIDGGHVLPVPGEYSLPTLYGDKMLSSKLLKFSTKVPLAQLEHKGGVRILKIDWEDRQAPPLTPAFWPALLAELKFLQGKKGAPLNVLTICQGGHGRSGSALAILIMLLTDYTPLDVLTHVRALHCARAIESKVQHDYLNEVAKFLGREPDAMDAEEVKSFKERFLTLTNPSALPYIDRVKNGKGAAVSERTSKFF